MMLNGQVKVTSPGPPRTVVSTPGSGSVHTSPGVPGQQGAKGDKGDPGDTGPAGTTSWAGITDKPNTFPPIIGAGATQAVAGNDARLTEVSNATYSATANTLMKRTSTGAVSVSTPTASVHAANRSYVDTAVSAAVEDVEDRLDTYGLTVPAGPVDVAAAVTANRTGMTSGQDYRDPTSGEVELIESAVDAILTDSTVPSLSSVGGTVTTGWDASTKQSVTILRFGTGVDECWGMYVIPSGPVSAIVAAPHPVFDSGSDDLALQMWQDGPPGVVLAAAGSHRTDTSGTNPRDSARNPQSAFHKIVTRIMASGGVTQLQVHGYADSALPAWDVVVSQGPTAVSPATSRLADRLEAAGLRVARYWQGDVTELAGTTNAQGVAAAAAGGIFCHVEINATTRSTKTAELRGAVTSSGWLHEQAGIGLSENVYPLISGSVNEIGSSRFAARADHRHRLVQNTPVEGDVIARLDGGWRATNMAALLPPGGMPGQVLGLDDNGLPAWLDR